MKQIIICCLTLTTVLGGNLNHIYAPLYHHGTPNLIDFGEHLDLSHTHLDHEYPAGILLGYGYISGLHEHHQEEQSYHAAQHPINPVSASLTHSFEKSLIAPELPKLQPQISTSIAASYQPQPTPSLKFSSNQQISTPIISQKYTSTPTQAYEVTEENLEPKPIPQLSQLPSFTPPTQLGSGSLGVVNYGNGNYAVGSGSLGYGGSSGAGQNTAQIGSSGTGGFTPILGALNYGGISSSAGSLSSIGNLNYGTASLGNGVSSGLTGGSSLGLHFGSLGYGGGGTLSYGSSSGYSSLGSSGSSGSGQIGSLHANSLQGNVGLGGLGLFKPQ